MSTLVPGEVIDVTLRGARVVCQGESLNMPGWLRLTTRSGDVVEVTHPSDGVEVTRIAPAQWPPQPGDLWVDRDGSLHFAVDYCPDYDHRRDAEGIDTTTGTRIVLVEQSSDDSALGADFRRPDQLNRDRGSLQLVYRHDQHDRKG